ncbi:MAG: VanZ family protein [Gemmatimonadaceae bacterium]|nr:VanZ family protein [Gemmatimonadaceae bacterium]
MSAASATLKPRFRRAADLTAARLGRAILGYLAVVTVIITLAPFRFAAAPVHGLTMLWDWSDSVMNVVMFVPIGFCFQLTRPAGVALSWTRVLLVGAALSGGIEIAQLFEATRFTSLVDVATNSGGALIGAALYQVVVRRIEGPSTVRTLALQLPLAGLVYLLVPLVWLTGLASAGDSRVWLVLPIVAFASGIIGTVYAAYIEPARRITRGWLLVAVLGWYVVALLPGAIRQRDVLLAGAAIGIGVTWVRSLSASRYLERHGTRRFEGPTLRLFMPLFAGYLALSSLWPLNAAESSWIGMWALLQEGETTTTSVFVALEHVAAFTLVGYIIAEFHGRDLEHYRQIVWRVVTWGGGLSLLLEAVRGFHPAYRASAPMVVFTIGAAVFGGWLYQLQRAHVRALLTRRTSPPAAISSDRDEPGRASL